MAKRPTRLVLARDLLDWQLENAIVDARQVVQTYRRRIADKEHSGARVSTVTQQAYQRARERCDALENELSTRMGHRAQGKYWP